MHVTLGACATYEMQQFHVMPISLLTPNIGHVNLMHCRFWRW